MSFFPLHGIILLCCAIFVPLTKSMHVNAQNVNQFTEKQRLLLLEKDFMNTWLSSGLNCLIVMSLKSSRTLLLVWIHVEVKKDWIILIISERNVYQSYLSLSSMYFLNTC